MACNNARDCMNRCVSIKHDDDDDDDIDTDIRRVSTYVRNVLLS